MAGVFKGSLTLNKITGIRHDKGQRMTYVPVKKTKEITAPVKSIKKTSPKGRKGETY
jgi:hypothetical protein